MMDCERDDKTFHSTVTTFPSPTEPREEALNELANSAAWANMASEPEQPESAQAGQSLNIPQPAPQLGPSVDSLEMVLDVKDAFGDLAIDDTISDKRSLQLMDLPVDVLEEIVKQISGSNDLISLAVCNSWLHAIVMPHMYSRFDIVWPEPGEETDSRPGVDALAYGLGTLVMSGTIYGPQHTAHRRCNKCGHADDADDNNMAIQLVSNYAQFVRKFAIGNGPINSVASYYYSTESGKMLGTLVALALTRMVNLEIFFWDMPTGIVKEVWTALSSLGRSRGGKEKPSALGSIWIRCHDSEKTRSPSQVLSKNLPTQSIGASPETLKPSYEQIEYPNFSALPPLRMIGVVEIDEVAYFEELAILIEKSYNRLRELRIGAARNSRLVTTDSVGPGYAREDNNTCLGAGGLLGLLLSRIYDCRQQQIGSPKTLRRQGARTDLSVSSLSLPAQQTETWTPSSSEATVEVEVDLAPPANKASAPETLSQEKATVVEPSDQPRSTLQSVPDDPVKSHGTKITPKAQQQEATPVLTFERAAALQDKQESESKENNMKLRLHVLELESIMLPSFVLRHALDWSVLTDITLLNCASDEQFWNDLKTVFAPTPKPGVRHGVKPTSLTHDFPLKLRKVRVDGVSNALISTLRDCLEQDTLECLFLQDRKSWGTSSNITVDAIYKGPLRRHRSSLQKLSIDSLFKHEKDRDSFQKWLLTRDVLAFICSGKMPRLRELAVSIKYDDWHYLLQNLPNLPRLRSLYIPFIHELPSAALSNARELAMQVLDIVTLRPEIEICYIGIQSKCFEILEGRKAELEPDVAIGDQIPSSSVRTDWGESLGEDFSSDDDDDDDFVQAPTASVVNTRTAEAGEIDELASDTDTSSEGGDARTSLLGRGPKLRLREILFYTEKVEIFKVEKGTIIFST